MVNGRPRANALGYIVYFFSFNSNEAEFMQ
jgi:hypothetical protein